MEHDARAARPNPQPLPLSRFSSTIPYYYPPLPLPFIPPTTQGLGGESLHVTVVLVSGSLRSIYSHQRKESSSSMNLVEC
jgi:hypothetical protein